MSYKIRVSDARLESGARRRAKIRSSSSSLKALIWRQAWQDVLEAYEAYGVRHFSAYPAMIAEYFKWKVYRLAEEAPREPASEAKHLADLYAAAALYYAGLAGEADPHAWLIDPGWVGGYKWFIQATPRHLWPDWFVEECLQAEELGRVQSFRGAETRKKIRACLDMGLGDHEIAAKLGLLVATVHAIRCGEEDLLSRPAPMLKYFRQGLRDEAIAEIFNCPVAQIARQRRWWQPGH